MATNERCKRFAQILAKQKGLTYSKATKMFERASKNEVYINRNLDRSEGNQHCVHCARAEALLKYGNDEKYSGMEVKP